MIATADVGIPTAGNAVVVVSPTDVPAVDGGSAVVGYLDSCRRAAAPTVGDHIVTAGLSQS